MRILKAMLVATLFGMAGVIVTPVVGIVGIQP